MRLLYQAPDDRTRLFDPAPEEFDRIFRESGDDYWLSGGNGEATIDVIRSPGEELPISARIIWPDGTSVEFLRDQPSLWIKRPEEGRFFFTWNGSGGWWVPFTGGDCQDFVLTVTDFGGRARLLT